MFTYKLDVLTQDFGELEQKINTLLQDLENSNSETISNGLLNSDKKIENLLAKLKLDLTERYNVLGDIDTNNFDNVAVELIKQHLQNDNDADIIQSVQGVFERHLKSLDDPSTQRSILNEIDPIAFPASSEVNDKIIVSELKDDQLHLYKEIEYLKLISLLFNNSGNEETVNSSPTFEEISKKLSDIKSSTEDPITSSGQLPQVKAQYAGFCQIKIQNIFDLLTKLVSSVDENHQNTFDHFKRVLSSNESFDSQNYVRHELYDEILKHLWNALASAKPNFIEKIDEWLKDLISKHWHVFLSKYPQLAGKSKAEVLRNTVSTDLNDVNVDEIKYQIANAIFEKVLTCRTLHEMSLKASHSSLKQILIEEGDKIYWQRVNINYFSYSTVLQYHKHIDQAKNFIVDEYERYCGMLDTSVKANYVGNIRLYLDRLDWVLGNRNNEMNNTRKTFWQTIESKVGNIMQNPDLVPEATGTMIEETIAAQINQMIFSTASDIPSTPLNHIDTPSSLIDSVFNRNYKTGSSVSLDDMFTICGEPVKKEWNKLQHKTVVVSLNNQETYYGLPDNLDEGSNDYKKKSVQFFEELSVEFRNYKMKKFRSAIVAYNARKCLKNLISICTELVFYFSLTNEHIECKNEFEGDLQHFLDIFIKTMDHLLIHQKCDQNILTQLRLIMGMFGQDVIECRLSNCTPEKKEILIKFHSNLKELRKTLSFKAFKESGYQLFTEERNKFSVLLKANKSKSVELIETVRSTILTVLQLRLTFLPKNPSEIFDNFENLFMKVTAIPSYDEISRWHKYWEKQQHEILLPDLPLNTFFENIRDAKKNYWIDILSTKESNIREQFVIHIIQRYYEDFTKEDLERLYIASIDPKIDAGFMSFVLQFYADKIEDEKARNFDKRITNTGKILLNAVMSNAFKTFQIVESSRQCKLESEYFIKHLKSLVDCIPNSHPSADDGLKTVLKSLEEVEKSFILNILKVNEISESMTVPNEATDAIIHLQLHLQLPNSCLVDKQDLHESFVRKVIETQWEADDNSKVVLNVLIKDLIYRYCTLYWNATNDFNKPLLRESISNEDAINMLKRYYDNLPPVAFIDCTKEIFEQKSQGMHAILVNMIVSILYPQEKEHLDALLRFQNIEERSNNQLNDETIEKRFEKSIYCKTIFESLTTSPSIMWEEEIVYMRTKKVEYFLIAKFSSGDIGLTKLSDFMDAFLFSHEQRGHLKDALRTLELMCTNVSKFETIEQIKQSLLALSGNVDLTKVNATITSAIGHQLTLDLLFIHIDAGNFPKLKATIDKLKILLSYRRFEDVSQFCRAILVHAREHQNLVDFRNTIELIIECKVYDRRETLADLLNKEFFLWASDLQKILLLDKLKGSIICGYGLKEKQKLVNLLFQLKDVKGFDVQKNVLEKIQKLRNNSPGKNAVKDLIGIIHKIIDKPINCNILQTLPTDLSEWEAILFSRDRMSQKQEILTVKELVESMKEGDKLEINGINEAVAPCIGSNSVIEESLIEIAIRKARNLKKSEFLTTSKAINCWEESDILEWSLKFSHSSLSHKVCSWRSGSNIATVAELLAVIIRAVVLYDHYPTGPRDTQLMAVLLFLDASGDGNGRLGNIYTGEGKTLITVMLATCLSLMGNIVDIVTSSKLLAVRDSKKRDTGSREGYQNFFKIFGLSASNNCDEACEQQHTGEDERKTRYANNQIIYGETGFFQRDILLTKFFRKEIRPAGDSIGHILILDEVDSMMIDNAAKTLYISHNITDMGYVRDVFIQIWAAVNSYEERNYSDGNVSKILKYINGIIDQDGGGEIKISIPSTLMDFVNRNLRTWIESAYLANYTSEDDEYIIGDYGSQQENEVIIMDKDTGVEQLSTKWSNGFHQFVQLKHSGRMSDESLKAVFISNSGYFQMYPKLYGMTGTVGGIEERKLLSQVYGIDFFEVPRFKEYKFEYDFESESVAGSSSEWLDNVVENVKQTMNAQLLYDEKYVLTMKENVNIVTSPLVKISQDIAYINENIESLKVKQSECDIIIDACERTRKFSQQISTLCENGDPEQKIQGIAVEIKNFKNQSPAQIREHLAIFDKWIEELCKQKTEFHLQEFGKSLNENVKIHTIATISNEHKKKLEALNDEIQKASGTLTFLVESKTKCETDRDFYLTESQQSVGSKRKDCRRAILIICENIKDVTMIEKEIQKKVDGDCKTYKYELACKKFDLSFLEKGDIVIATNIAGRGTDLEVSPEVEANGGLHVILTYMPTNFRVEKQAFGRTARAGNKGTGTYIVFDVRRASEDDVDICQLKTERNDNESRRLRTVLNEELPKVRLEDELFTQFTNLQQTIQQQLMNMSLVRFVPNKDLPRYSRTPLDLQLASLNNKWALWLNKMNEQIAKKVNEKQVVFMEFDKFRNEMIEKLNERYGLIGEPGELTKLGRLYMDNKQFSDALACFRYIIEHHHLFAGIAYYYSAFCVVHLDDGDYAAKFKAKSFLKKSLILLEDEMNRILSRNQILKSINNFRRNIGKATDSNVFAKQNEGLAQLLSEHISAIHSGIGSSISPDNLIGPGVSPDQAQRIYVKLLEKNCTIKNYRISKKCSIVDGTLKVKDTRVEFPSIFDYCKEQTLDIVSKSLEKSRNNGWWYKDREITASSFEGMIYTKDKFETEMKEFIEVEEMVEIDENIEQKLLGRLSNSVFCDNGEVFKETLTNEFLEVDKTLVQKALDNPEFSDDYFLPLKLNKSDIRRICLDNVTFYHNTGYLVEKVFLEKVVALSTAQQGTTAVTKNSAEFIKLLSVLNLNVKRYVSLKYLTELVREKAKSISDENIKEVIWHLEHYVKISIDHNFLKRKFDVKNESIFFGKKSAIKAFCLGERKIEIANGTTIHLLHNKSFSKDEIVESLKILTETTAHSTPEHLRNFDELISHLEFTGTQPIQAIKTYKRYHFADPTLLDKIKVFLKTFSFSTMENKRKTHDMIEQLNLDVDQRLGKKSKEIKDILKSRADQENFHFDKDTFQIDEEAFGILRAILTDMKLIDNSIVHVMKGIDHKQSDVKINAELENILMNIYNGNGVISDKDLVLKDEKTGSRDMFSRLLNMKILKPAKVYFPLGRANVPNFVGGNYWRQSSDPAKRVEYITNEIENVVVDVFQLQRESDIKHTVVDTVIGFGTESKNKELDDKITTITNIIKQLAGTLNIHPQVKLQEKNLRSIVSETRIQREIIEYIHKSFDVVIDYSEKKAIDWDCLLCGIIGVAQIVAGVTLEILSDGVFHFYAQALISEGVGDIVFAIQSGIEGNFSWKAYNMHKVQSIMLTVLTCGVGRYLASGANVGKMGVGLATKTAKFKAVAKTVIVESCTAVCSAIVNVGSNEISKLVMDELTNEHFMKYFEKWIRDNRTYEHKRQLLEQKLNSLYKKFGVDAVSQSVNACLDNSLNQLMTGSLGSNILNKLFSIVNSIGNSFSMAKKRFKMCRNKKAEILGQIASLLGKTTKAANLIQNFVQLCEICNDFNDAMIAEIVKLEKSLLDQEKKGTLKVNKEQIGHQSFTEETRSILHKSEERMRIAFFAKIKSGFLQPVISSAMHKGIGPIKDVLLSPFSNALQHLEAHIERREQKMKKKLKEQTPYAIVSLTTAQKKALEIRGSITKADEAPHEWLNITFSNVPGETIESLRKKLGSDLSFFVCGGELIAVIPTFKQTCKNIRESKPVGSSYFRIVAQKEKRGITVLSVSVHGTDSVEHHEKIPYTISGGDESSDCYNVAMIEGHDDDPGHLVPVIKDANGKWIVVNDIRQPEGTENACAAQCFLYLQEYERTRDMNKAKLFAENPDNVKKYNKDVAKFGENSKACKDDYLRGRTVRDNVFVGNVANISKTEDLIKNLPLNNEKYSNINQILPQLNTDCSKNNIKKRLKLAKLLPLLIEDSLISLDVANDYLKNVLKGGFEHLYDPNCNETQIYVMKWSNHNLSTGENVILVQEQWAFIPLNSPKSSRKKIRMTNGMTNAMIDMKKTHNGYVVMMHIINAKAGGPSTSDNTFASTQSMNMFHYYRCEKLYLKLKKGCNENGALFIKSKIDCDQFSTLPTALHISIGTTNGAVQKDLDLIFGENPNYKRTQRRTRSDYATTILHVGSTECTEEFSSSTETEY